MGRTWRDLAECRDVNTTWLYKTENEHAAARMCNRCIVTAECLQYATTEQVEFGVWGGYRFDIKLPPAKLRLQKTRNETVNLKDFT